MGKITSPKEFFGHDAGEDKHFINFNKLVEYYELLAAESERIKVIDLGPTTMGNRFIMAIVSSEKNIVNLEEIRKSSKKLADPRGLSENETDELIKRSKCVCMQTMSLHAHETGGMHMAPKLVYTLLSSDSEEVLQILNNVVYLQIPSFNPDGALMFYDWYNQSVGKVYEGSEALPWLYHKYAGHDNNRDAVAQNLVESNYVAKVMLKDWMPQSYQDFHHMCSDGPRLFVVPYSNPIRENLSPLIYREHALYGAGMSCQLESKNVKGVISGALYDGWGNTCIFNDHASNHNITGMLTEAATAMLVSPLYIPKDYLKGPQGQPSENNKRSIEYPNPWEGGWWKFSDIVREMYLCAFSQLETMAKNRELLLYNMVKKALGQTQRGREDKDTAYIISADQFDTSCRDSLFEMLLKQDFEMYIARESFIAGKKLFPESSVVIPLAQPKYAAIVNILKTQRCPVDIFPKNPNGSARIGTSINDCMCEFMNVKLDCSNGEIEGGKFERFTKIEYETSALSKACGYIMTAKNNTSYLAANLLLKKGFKVWRIGNRYHDFYVEGDCKLIEECANKAHTTVFECSTQPENLTSLELARVAFYRHHSLDEGNTSAGWANLFFERFGFDFNEVYDPAIRNGCLKDYDTLIIPSSEKDRLFGFFNLPKNPLARPEIEAPEYRSGLNRDGFDAILDFTKNGGRLIVMEKSCDFAIEECDLHITNLTRNKPRSEFATNGSTLHVIIDNSDPVTYGMPEEAVFFHNNGPSFEINSISLTSKYRTPVRYTNEDTLCGGMLLGEKYICGKCPVVIAPYGKGEVILYNFQPFHRGQKSATFKLMFNMLYK